MASIYLLSTSTAVQDRPAFRLGLARLKALGHTVEVDEAALQRAQRFAGDDATRLAALARAAASGADIVMGTRGGYGLSRLLARLPHKALAKSVERGSRWIGFSDWTALQLAHAAWWQREGGSIPAMSWWQGPMAVDDWCKADELDEITQACFGDFVDGVCEGGGWRLPARDVASRVASIAPESSAPKSIATKRQNTPTYSPKDSKNASRSISGMLWGGNLSMIASLVGTPHMPSVPKGILWLEDIAEHPYRCERLLTQLLHAGVLAQQKAVVFAQFSAWKPLPNDRGYDFNTVADWLRGQIKAPVFTGLPFGHVPTKLTLPQFTPARLMTEGRDVLMYWG